MKSNAKPSNYFSIYLSNSFRQPSAAGDQSLFLKSILNGELKSFHRTHVLPLINSHTSLIRNIPDNMHSPVPEEDISQNENGWYQNYE